MHIVCQLLFDGVHIVNSLNGKRNPFSCELENVQSPAFCRMWH